MSDTYRPGPPWIKTEGHGVETYYLDMPGAGIHDIARVLMSLPGDATLQLSDGFMGGIWWYPAIQPGDKTGTVFL